MDDRMLEQHLQQLIDQLELNQKPMKDERGTYLLILSSEMQVSIKDLEPGLFLHAPLLPLQTAKREELLIYLMKANFLGQGTGGSVIGLDDDEKFLTLSLVMPYDMNYKNFRDSLEDFTNYVDYWREELVRFKKASEERVFG
jgi:hypothetical protein